MAVLVAGIAATAFMTVAIRGSDPLVPDARAGVCATERTSTHVPHRNFRLRGTWHGYRHVHRFVYRGQYKNHKNGSPAHIHVYWVPAHRVHVYLQCAPTSLN